MSLNDIPNYVAVPLSVMSGFLISWFVARWYHKKREMQDKIWKKNRELSIFLIYQTLGTSYRNFKDKFKILLDKEKINEHDYVAWKNNDYTKLANMIKHNAKIANESYHTKQHLISREEYEEVSMFFSNMLWFISHFQNEHFSSIHINNLQHDINELEKRCIAKYPNFLEMEIMKSIFPVRLEHKGSPFK